MGELEGEDVVHLNRHLWDFLNINLSDDAWEVFENCDKGQGFQHPRFMRMCVYPTYMPAT